MINDVLPLLFSEDLAATATFYRDGLGMVVVFESDWYIQLQGPNQAQAQLGVIAAGHESVPERFHAPMQGVAVTIETDDVDAIHAVAAGHGVPIHVSLRDEDWGQRHFTTEDPNGIMVDVVQMLT